VHGGIVHPYGSTFLVFSDYMRASVRLSALMEIPVVWVWTHDSVGLGEDGPTHQPVEHYAALRAIPNLWVIRPADANETSIAWKVALARTEGPVAILLSRQNLPVLEPEQVAGADRGGYVVWEAESDNGLPDLLMLATGSEVWVTIEAAKKLQEDGVSARVVSMPCWELFEEQPSDYRDSVLPPDVDQRIAVEAGVSLGWQRWVGMDGAIVSIEHFGASAPGAIVLEKFGYTPENIASRAQSLLERRQRV
jgi:transketolase